MRLVRIFVVVLCCAGFIWLAVKSAAVGALLKTNPTAASLFAPGDPRIISKLAVNEFASRAGNVSPALRAASIQSLRRAPLAYEPFLIGAVDALITKKSNPDELLQEASRRNPRSRLGQLLLLDQHLRAGRVEEAISTMNLLTRLVPGARTVLVRELARFARARESRPAIKNVLAGDPVTKESLLEYLASDPGNAELILELGSAGNSRGSRTPAWQPKLVDSLIQGGQTQRAHRLWQRLSGVEESRLDGLIYNPGFRQVPGFPPFNWRFSGTNSGSAEPDGNQGLQVEYYGRTESRLVEQLLLLAPGRYRLSSSLRGSVHPEGGKVAWKISCNNSGRILLDLSLTGEKSAEARSQLFTVPSGCGSQWLALLGSPSEFPKDQILTVGALNLEKAN